MGWAGRWPRGKSVPSTWLPPAPEQHGCPSLGLPVALSRAILHIPTGQSMAWRLLLCITRYFLAARVACASVWAPVRFEFWIHVRLRPFSMCLGKGAHGGGSNR